MLTSLFQPRKLNQIIFVHIFRPANQLPEIVSVTTGSCCGAFRNILSVNILSATKGHSSETSFKMFLWLKSFSSVLWIHPGSVCRSSRLLGNGWTFFTDWKCQQWTDNKIMCTPIRAFIVRLHSGRVRICLCCFVFRPSHHQYQGTIRLHVSAQRQKEVHVEHLLN